MANNILEEIKEKITFETVLQQAMKVPGVKINREAFLKTELKKFYPEGQVLAAIRNNPAKAGISKEAINKISLDVINYETKRVVAISVAASLPSSAAAPIAIGAASADIVSYFAFILRAVQKLAYLYGFDEFDFNDDDIDSETMDFILVFLGVMFGVQGATIALNKLAQVMAANIAKNLGKEALTKTVIYPIVKEIATKVGIHMTKQVFADTVASAVPLVGAALSGGLTYVMYKPCCMRLRKNLMSYKLCDPEFYANDGNSYMDDLEYVEVIDISDEDLGKE